MCISNPYEILIDETITTGSRLLKTAGEVELMVTEALTKAFPDIQIVTAFSITMDDTPYGWWSVTLREPGGEDKKFYRPLFL